MKNKKIVLAAGAVIVSVIIISCGWVAGNSNKSGEPWTEKQLIEPSELNKILADAKLPKPTMFSIGFGGGIPGSVEMGAARDEVNLQKFKAALEKLPKDKDIVIYCGCCPFEPCPNIRPAFILLNNMGFTNHKLLNLKENFKVDWIDKGYPVNK